MAAFFCVSVSMLLEALSDFNRKSIKAIVTGKDGSTLDITYSSEKATVEDMANLRVLVTTDTPEEDAIRHMLVLFGTTWNLQTKDEGGNLVDVEPTFEGMKKVSMKALTMIAKAIQDDMAPKATTPEISDAG